MAGSWRAGWQLRAAASYCLPASACLPACRPTQQAEADARRCPQLVVGYWSIRGLGAPLRMMCEYAGVDYEPRCYDALPQEGGGWDVSDWFGKKPELYARNALMNLPFVEDGEHIVAQTNACFSHLGRVLGLNGAHFHSKFQ